MQNKAHTKTKGRSSIFITGGAGYIGSHTVKLFLSQGYDITIFDSLDTGFKEAVELLKTYVNKKEGQTLNFIQGDLKNLQQINNALKPSKNTKKFEAVIHFAAHCSVPESMAEPAKYFINNVNGTVNLLEAMKEANIDKLIFSSTCATYGETLYVPLDEKHSQIPVNPYGESKLMAEKAITWYGNLFNIQSVILRYFNVCGASEDGIIGDSKKPSPHLMQNVVRGALGIEEFKLTCPKVDTEDGSPIRDYTNVNDLAEAHLKALEFLNRGNLPIGIDSIDKLSDDQKDESTKKTHIFNIGTGKGFSVLEIVNEVEKILDVKMSRTIGEARKGEYARIFADYKKALEYLGWKPKRSLEESIKSLEKWYKNKSNGYKS